MKIGVVDFFCGCGGASAGFAAARTNRFRFEIICGIDIDRHSRATFERMHGVPALDMDIHMLAQSSALLDQLVKTIKRGKFDKVIFIGCAPCQGFAAHRKAVPGADRRRPLFGAFCQVVDRLRPDFVFMENVPDIFSSRHWPHFSAGRGILEAAGYNIRGRIYNFAGFGLPQERFRAVVLASRQPFVMPEPSLTPSTFSTVRKTIGHLPPLKAGEAHRDDPMHVTSKHRPETVAVLARIPKDGGNRPVGVGPKCLDRARLAHGGYTDVYGRLAWNKPAVTITARCRTPSCGRFAHPEQNRGLSVREAALLQGFPGDYMFEGPFDDRYKQIGNAVPPLVAEQIALHIGRILSGVGPRQSARPGTDIVAPVGPGFAVKINGIKQRRDQQREEVTLAI
jgi:DNA (cytosine-5)-methyltransferase 1